MDKIVVFFLALRIFWPPTAIRIILRGSREVAAFRRVHHREPTKREWQEIADRVGHEVLHD